MVQREEVQRKCFGEKEQEVVLLLFLLQLEELVWEVPRGQKVLVGCLMEEGEEQKAEEEQTKGSGEVFEVKRRLEEELLLLLLLLVVGS